MKKLITITTLIALVIVVGIDAASKGPVKVPLLVWDYATGSQSNEVVGFATFNITANGMLKAVVHLDNGKPDTTFWVGLRAEDKDGNELEVEGELTTNKQGNGNTWLEMKLPDDIPNPVKAEVKLIGPPTYSTPFKWTEVPLKK